MENKIIKNKIKIVQKIDIFLTNPKIPHYLLQYPIRTQPFNEFNMPVEARIKPNAQQLELDLTINTRAVTYDRQKADELARGLVEESSIGPGRKLIKKEETLEKQTLSSSLLPKNGNYMFGVVKNGIYNIYKRKKKFFFKIINFKFITKKLL